MSTLYRRIPFVSFSNHPIL